MAAEPEAVGSTSLNGARPHLFVDLDGTLIRTDLLFESLLLLIKRNPLYLAALPIWLLRGRASLKRQIARRIPLDAATLPYNSELLEWLREQRRRGRKMTLISASDQHYTGAVAEQVGLFDGAIGSDGAINLKARAKLRRIRELARGQAFAYAGDSRADLPIWARARQCVLVNCSDRMAKRLAELRANASPGDAAGDPAPQSPAAEHFAGSGIDSSRMMPGRDGNDDSVEHRADPPVESAHGGGTAERGRGSRDVNGSAEVLRFGAAPALFGPLLCAMRPHQWLKNALLFVPLILSHQATQPGLALAAAIGFVGFCLCASSVYLLNDLLDLANDRAHRSKRQRPFAAGDLPIAAGFAAAPVLLAGAFGIALLLPAQFRLLLLLYWLLTCLYSFALKRIFLLDVATLAILYALRVAAGAAAITVEATNFLIVFSLCFFFGLAIVKRVTELVNLPAAAQTVGGRAYRKSHEQLLSALGGAVSAMAVVIFALYINAPATTDLYSTPTMLWLVCPVLIILLARIWLFARAGRLHEDPVLFAVEDRLSQALVLAAGIVLWLAA